MTAPGSAISRDGLESFISNSESAILDSPQMNESNTKFKLIQPFLEDVLGWDRLDIESEYSVQMGGQTYHVDYALTINDQPEVFVEAKGCDTSFRETHVSQLQSYLKLKDVTWGLLSNGKEYRLYQLDVSSGSTEFHLIADPSYDELDKHIPAISAISKSKVESGESATIVENIREMNTAILTLENQKQDIAGEITTTLTNRTTDLIYNDAEEEAKKLIDNLVEKLRSDRSSKPRRNEPPAVVDEDFPLISLAEIEDDPNSQVGVYPSNESGIEFLKTYTAWGFISIAQNPDYFMIYISKPHQEIQFVGVVDEIVPADEYIGIHDIQADNHKYGENKKVLKFSELYKLTDPIPLGDENPHRMQGLLYTTLEQTQNAASTDDI